jgi:hypothetical protein
MVAQFWQGTRHGGDPQMVNRVSPTTAAAWQEYSSVRAGFQYQCDSSVFAGSSACIMHDHVRLLRASCMIMYGWQLLSAGSYS